MQTENVSLAKFKSKMLIPDHLEIIEGKLSELAGLLTVAYQNEILRTSNHA